MIEREGLSMEEERLYRRTVVKETVPSRLLPEGSRDIRVYLPPGYTEHDRYAVVYCQDGEDFFNFGRIATIAQRLILEEIWAPFAVVGVDVDKRRRTAEYAPDGERHETYVRFWEEELLPFVEARFAFRTDPPGRVLAGASLGAAVSLALALRRPREFPNVLAFSGAFDEATLRLIRAAEDLSALRVWLFV
jgi:enterochelin esterase-like enzyme